MVLHIDHTTSTLEHSFVCALAPCTLWLEDESCWDIELETNSHVYFYCVLQLYMSEFEMRSGVSSDEFASQLVL